MFNLLYLPFVCDISKYCILLGEHFFLTVGVLVEKQRHLQIITAILADVVFSATKFEEMERWLSTFKAFTISLLLMVDVNIFCLFDSQGLSIFRRLHAG